MNLPVQLFDDFLPVVFQSCSVISSKIISNWSEHKEMLPKMGDIDMTMEITIKNIHSSEEFQEVIKEKMLRDVSRTYVELVMKLLLNDGYAPSKIFQYFSQRFEYLCALLSTVVTMVTIEDSVTILRCISFFSWIIPILMPVPDENFELFGTEKSVVLSPMLLSVVGDLVKALLVALTWERMEVHHNYSLTLLCLICQHALALKSNLVLDIIKTLPNVNQDNFKSFEDHYSKAPSKKGKKNVLKSFLTEVVGMTLGANLFKKKSNILDMPDTFFINQVGKSKNEDDIPLEFITQLFDKLGET